VKNERERERETADVLYLSVGADAGMQAAVEMPDWVPTRTIGRIQVIRKQQG
jgi:hypothetical protein